MRRRKREERWRRDSREIAEYLDYLGSICSTFSMHTELTQREVSQEARAVMEFLKGRRYLERSGCLSLLTDVHREWFRSCPDTSREGVFDSIEAEYERYFKALTREGYQ